MPDASHATHLEHRIDNTRSGPSPAPESNRESFREPANDPTNNSTRGAAPRLSSVERAFLNRFQGGFPLTDRPYRQVAETLGTDESTLIATIEAMLERRLLSRFGPLYNAERLGGAFSLAAMKVPEPDFERIAQILNGIPEVAHNYRRGHALNMWFVLAASSQSALNDAIMNLEAVTGLTIYNFPKEREFHLGLWLHLEDDGRIGIRRVERSHADLSPVLDRLDRTLISETQAGLPLVPRPYAQIAERIGCNAGILISRLERLVETGAVRRIGAVPNHYRLGLRGNGMSVWDIDDAHVDALGEQLGVLDFVSHCYRRPRHLPLWPYNLFAMVHGQDRAEVLQAAARLETIVSAHCRDHDVLFSDAILKKTGLRIFRADTSGQHPNQNRE